MMKIVCALLFVILGCAAQMAVAEEPIEAPVCQIKSDPSAFNHKLIKVTGFVSHAFEDFTILDPKCPDWPAVWLEYGGKAKSGTMYCCGVTDDRSRPKELKVEKILISLLDNEEFRKFDNAIQPPFRSGQHGAIVHATLVGRFFAGTQIKYPKGSYWGGYGHLGCCSLLAIQEVKESDTDNRSDLDYGASSDQPDINEAGCGFKFLLPIEQTAGLLQLQTEADGGKRDWAFDDPQRVAAETLATVTKLDLTIGKMELKREGQGRKVYEWKAAGKKETYMVVVSRPYLLSYYARDPKRVAWVPTAAYESSCGRKNSVTRIK